MKTVSMTLGLTDALSRFIADDDLFQILKVTAVERKATMGARTGRIELGLLEIGCKCLYGSQDLCSVLLVFFPFSFSFPLFMFYFINFHSAHCSR